MQYISRDNKLFPQHDRISSMFYGYDALTSSSPGNGSMLLVASSSCLQKTNVYFAFIIILFLHLISFNVKMKQLRYLFFKYILKRVTFFVASDYILKTELQCCMPFDRRVCLHAALETFPVLLSIQLQFLCFNGFFCGYLDC